MSAADQIHDRDVHVDWHMFPEEWQQLRAVLLGDLDPADSAYIQGLKASGALPRRTGVTSTRGLSASVVLTDEPASWAEAQVGARGGLRMDEARAHQELGDLGVYLVRVGADGVIDLDGHSYLMICPDEHPLAGRLRGRVFDGITAVEKFIREDCVLLRTRRRRAAVQRAADDIDAAAPGILKIELPTSTITDLMCPDGSRITIKTDARGKPAIEIPRGVHARADVGPERWAAIGNGRITLFGHGWDDDGQDGEGS